MSALRFCVLSLFLPVFLFAEPLNVSVNAEGAILMNADTGAILYEKNAKSAFYPASITKVATAAYTLHLVGNKLDKKIAADQESLASISEEAKRRSNYTLPAYWLVPGGTHIGIKKGEELTLRDLIYGMMIASGNDASNVIAQDLGGTIPHFMEDMNVYLQSLGCKNTTFCNPHGLHHPKHVTSAYDMAIIAREALKNPSFREVVSSLRYARPKTNKQEATTLVQTNRLLKKGKHYYSKALGVKTGYTSQAQNTFVSAASNGNRTLIAVLLKSKERDDLFQDTVKLFEAAFNQPKVRRTVVKAGPQKFVLEHDGAVSQIKTYAKEDLVLEYYPAEETKVKGLLYWDKVSFPIGKDTKVGELRIQTEDGRVLQTTPLLAQQDVKASWSYWLKSFFSSQ